MNRVWLLLTALLIACPVLAEAEAATDEVTDEVAQEARPIIGLALGGGGARGMAHIGVLLLVIV